MSHVTERLIVRKYLLPALPTDQVFDQLAYEPTGSTTPALIAITHHISRLRVIFICLMHSHRLLQSLWCYQPFNTVSKTAAINYTSQCLTLDNKLLVKQISSWLPVSRSIIQGSGIGPYLYLVYASDLRTLSPHNVIIKYAGEALLVGQHSSVD